MIDQLIFEIETNFNLMKTKTSLFALNVIFCVFLMLTSCTDPGFDEAKLAPTSKLPEASITGGPLFSSPITIGRIDIFTVTSNTVSGTVTMQIRNADGSAILGTSVVSGANLIKGNSIRNTFTFSPAVSLNSNQKYRIYVTRSNPHNYLSDYVAWRTSSSGVNAYTPGVPDVFVNSGWVLDYSFVTYSDGFVDQQQTSTNYGFAIFDTTYRWQEFVPQKIWVIQP